MAAIKEIKRKGGASAFQISYRHDGARRFMSLGSSYSRREVEQIRAVVERLVVANTTGEQLDRRTAAYLATASDDLRGRLVAAGLVEEDKRPTLGDVWDGYWAAEYYDLKPCTQSSKRQSRRRFFEFFPGDKLAEDMTRRDGVAFVDWLDERIGEATRAGTVRDVRRVFNWAKEAELVERNPFDGIRRGSFKNKAREYYVPRADFAKMLDACPSPMWRAVLALYRFGGLRKEEALRAEWSDVDFPGGRLLVHSPKTERYKGREARIIPLFPELRRELLAYFETLPEGSPAYIVAENRGTITKHVEKIVFLAGLKRWGRLIQNLRSSRAIEIFEEFGELAEAEWIGHGARTARDHYLHVLDSTFERAAGLAKANPAEVAVAIFDDRKNDRRIS